MKEKPTLSRPVLAVLIATRNRPADLGRALDSIWRQARKPDILVVVDDCRENETPVDAPVLGKAARDRGITAIYLENRRSSGPAGTWNSGLDEIARRRYADPQQVFVAVLDDDDTWEPNHLEACFASARSGNLHMVVSGIIRFDEEHPQGTRHALPEKLDADQLLVAGQHIQGSNLFVRLDKLLEAGLFSEELPSCTDRDLCLKLADLGDMRLGCTGLHTVHHHACRRLDRCSTPGSPQKTNGLNAFYAKYRHRMSSEIKTRFIERTSKLFGWWPTSPLSDTASLDWRFPEAGGAGTDSVVALVVGIIANSAEPETAWPLLEDLRKLSRHPSVAELSVVVVENGRPADGQQPLRELIAQVRQQGLACYYADLEGQRRDAVSGTFGVSPESIGTVQPIAVARTIVSVYAARLARSKPNTWVWLLDDDSRLKALVDTGQAGPQEVSRPDFGELHRLKSQGVDVVIGPCTGAAPLPFLCTLRTQMLDLIFALQTLDSLSPDDLFPNCSLENREKRRASRDYNYDFSRADYCHLESPVWFANGENEACRTICHRLAGEAQRILAGEEVFRPFVLDPGDFVPAKCTDTVRRGGSALIFNPEHLLQIPNFIAHLDGKFTRRSDMLWAVLGSRHLGWKVVESACIARLQDRGQVKLNGADFDKLRQDVWGNALYSTLNELFEWRAAHCDCPTTDLILSPQEMEWSKEHFRKLLRERTAAASLSLWRVMGLARALRHAVQQAGKRHAWWLKEADFEARLTGLLEWVEREITLSRLERFKAGVLSISDEAWEEFTRGLRSRLNEFQVACGSFTAEGFEAEQQRREIARARVATLLKVGDLQFLGAGAEGVVFTDGCKVYKFFDAWKRRDVPPRDALLRQLIGKWPGARWLYPLEQWLDDGCRAVLVYPYEPSHPYTGGHGAEIVGLLNECRVQRIVFRNFHPKNLRVTATGVRLIDYGVDIEPWSEPGFRMMAKRAWLTWRWPHRADLAEILSRALHEEALPELEGFEQFWQALNPGDAFAALYELLLKETTALKPPRILDYGCGKGKLATKLAACGVKVLGYDPNMRLQERWQITAAGTTGLRFTTNRSEVLREAKFDVVICSLVLCEIPDGCEFDQIIFDLRERVSDEGRVLVAVCNPFFTFGGPTPLHVERKVPDGAAYESNFMLWEKTSRESKPRPDAHRPLRRLRRELMRAGLVIEEVKQTQTVDLDRFEPASDFLVLCLRPVPNTPRPVSLLIKSCAMEWETVEAQVQHLVGQLEGPFCFHERVLVVDSKRGDFLRQYAEADVESFDESVRRLLEYGWIDRVVRAPADASNVAALYQRWYGTAASSTHAGNGAQLAAVLAGIEQCAGEYVLHVDSDAMICRRDSSHDYLAEMAAVLEADPLAVTVALNIAHRKSKPFTSRGTTGPWRVESRAGLIQRRRLLEGRPYQNEAADGILQLPWCRSLDRAVNEGRFNSYRGGDCRTFYTHPPNVFKRRVADWMLVLDSVERGRIAEGQYEKCDLEGSVKDWLLPLRNEPFIFVICGRNVSPGRFWRCFDSVLSQRRKDWGAIVIDDDSGEESRDFVDFLCREHARNVTLIRARCRRGLLANLVLAVRGLCGNPNSVVITLDADDALLGSNVLDRVAKEYEQGADVTVGSMLRTDKHALYPVSFESPRQNRGGNVWQHLRTFKKRLFDMISDEVLRLDGQYVQMATDWAFMIPILELAQNPVHIPEALYLYEPHGVGKGQQRRQREETIAHLMAKKESATT